MTVTLTLKLDELDYKTIVQEVEGRRARCSLIDGTPPGEIILPDGESCETGAVLAECCRDLAEYRALSAARRRDERAANEPAKPASES